MGVAMCLCRKSTPEFAKRASGFTYLWVLIIVALLAALLVTSAEIYATSVRRDREKELIFFGRKFREAIGRYYEGRAIGGVHEYPENLEDLLRDRRYPGIVRYLRKIYVDPITGKAEWGVVRIGGRVVGIYSFSNKEPIKQARFDASEASFAGKKKYSEWVFTYPDNLLFKPDESFMPDGGK